MKGIRFYLEYPSKQAKQRATRKSLGNHLGTVIAVETKTFWWVGKEYFMQAYGGVFNQPNSYVCGTCTTWEYLYDRCKRISEQQAKEIHPKLIDYLNQ
jgi:hypothetical protein